VAAPDDNARYRPFRGLAWGFYLLVAVTFSIAITVNVVRSTLAMTPEPPPPSTEVLSTQECVARARALWTELDQRRNSLSDPPDAGSVRRVDVDWTHFRVEWLTRHNQTASRCTTQGPDRELLTRIYKELDAVMDLYTTNAVQFAGEVGPTLDALRVDLKVAEKK
jgi:hypothetical protein